MRRAIIAAAATAALLIGLSGTADAMRDPFIVCVTEPCGPQFPELPPLPFP